ncbi:MAG: xanthine dehydrogenase family protein molybdopterin-binding subunit [Proteobacteria bacterium]|nr:xanthine dehydrogenase family protein molybdopterin-binding subunit [Pseudomonadota bacterium]
MPDAGLPNIGQGQSPRRREDARLLAGAGRYTGDVTPPRTAHAAIVRSPHPHARLLALDVSAASGMPGVLGAYTAGDLAADGVRPMPCIDLILNRDGSPCAAPPYPVLAEGRVRFVGQPVALVVAETLDQARDAAEAVAVDYDPLPAITDPRAAIGAGAPRIWDEASDNLCADWGLGDPAAVEAAFAGATHQVELSLTNNRVAPASLEPRGAVGSYDPGTGCFHLHSGCQGVHNLRDWMAEPILGVSPARLRVTCDDVGGGFGMKSVTYPEQVLALWAARRLGRPVKWMSDRSEAFLSDSQAREQDVRAALALDGEGRILGLRVDIVANMGGCLSGFAPAVPSRDGGPMICGVYDVPAVDLRVRCVFTNTVPVDAYRGAGRPEASYIVERLIDRAARATGMDPAELRRINMLGPERFPHRTPTGLTYDSGRYTEILDRALAKAERDGFPARRAASATAGRLRGLGMAYYVERCGVGGTETARIRFEASGEAVLYVGTQTNGQGHETAFAQVLAGCLPVPFERIRVVQGDTHSISYGRGTGGSRSLQMCGPAILRAAEKIVEKGKAVAVAMLEVAVEDIAFEDGAFVVRGTDRRVAFDEMRARVFKAPALPAEIEPGLDEQAVYTQEGYSFPNGCHIAEVEIDPETGVVAIPRYTAVDDFGVVLNPMLTEGQVHGSLAQGLGQALLEHAVYDPETGQPLAASFLDYAMPRAADFPLCNWETVEVPSTANPIGVKGCAEAGCVGGPPALVNAVLDALAPLGIYRIDMPLTPHRVWQAIREKTGATPD